MSVSVECAFTSPVSIESDMSHMSMCGVCAGMCRVCVFRPGFDTTSSTCERNRACQAAGTDCHFSVSQTISTSSFSRRLLMSKKEI